MFFIPNSFWQRQNCNSHQKVHQQRLWVPDVTVHWLLGHFSWLCNDNFSPVKFDIYIRSNTSRWHWSNFTWAHLSTNFGIQYWHNDNRWVFFHQLETTCKNIWLWWDSSLWVKRESGFEHLNTQILNSSWRLGTRRYMTMNMRTVQALERVFRSGGPWQFWGCGSGFTCSSFFALWRLQCQVLYPNTNWWRLLLFVLFFPLLISPVCVCVCVLYNKIRRYHGSIGSGFQVAEKHPTIGVLPFALQRYWHSFILPDSLDAFSDCTCTRPWQYHC